MNDQELYTALARIFHYASECFEELAHPVVFTKVRQPVPIETASEEIRLSTPLRETLDALDPSRAEHVHAHPVPTLDSLVNPPLLVPDEAPPPPAPKKTRKKRAETPAVDPAAPPSLPTGAAPTLAPSLPSTPAIEPEREALSAKIFELQSLVDKTTDGTPGGPEGLAHIRRILVWAEIENVLTAPMAHIRKCTGLVDEQLAALR